MKVPWLLLSASAAAMALLLCGNFAQVSRAVPPIAPSPEAMRWGAPVPNGLQMGAWRSENPGWVYCLIRSQGRTPVHYSDYFVGYWENVLVWARPVSTATWTRLPRARSPFRAYKGVGPGLNSLTVKRGEKIVLQNAYYQKGDRVYFSAGFISLPLSASPAPPTKRAGFWKDLIKSPQITNHTFVVDLADFDWPEAWTGPVEIAVEQKMNSDTAQKPQQASHENETVLRSGTLVFSPEKIQSFREPRTNRVVPAGQVLPVNFR